MNVIAPRSPWKYFGNELHPNASIEEWARVSGMDFRIQASPVLYQADGKILEVPERKILWHNRTGAWLGDVGCAFHVFQPQDILVFSRDVAKAAGFTLRSAGTMFEGRRMWALAATGMHAHILDPQDTVAAALLLSSACDGTMTTEGRYIIIVTNGNAALPLDGQSVKVPHRTVFRPEIVKAQLDVEGAKSQFDKTISLFRTMAETKLSPRMVEKLTIKLFNARYEQQIKAVRWQIDTSKPVRSVIEMAVEGGGAGSWLAGRKKGGVTVWGWLTCVIEYVDHHTRAHNTSKASAEDNRFDSAMFGRGAVLKAKAKELATELC